jgi:hypothetical protein
MKRFMVVAGMLVAPGVACTKSEPTSAPDEKPGVRPRSEIAVELAGVTLAEDCADGVRTKPLQPPPQPSNAGSGKVAQDQIMPPAAPSQTVQAGACATPGGCGSLPQPACDQTAMQLSLKVPDGASASTIKIKKVELLDDSGKSVASLTWRAPSKWDGSSAYVAWDEAIPAGKANHVVSYKLSAPDWNALTGGRWNAPSKRFNLRVTVTIGSKDKTIEKQSIQPATPEPHVVT